MRAGQGIDQLPGDTHPRSGFAHRAFQNIADPQLAPDLFHVNGAALVGKGRIAGDDEEPADLRESRNDLLDHAVSEIFLFRVAAHIGEGQHRDRWLVGERQNRWYRGRRWALGGGASVANPVDPHWASDVLDVLLAPILEDKGEPIANV